MAKNGQRTHDEKDQLSPAEQALLRSHEEFAKKEKQAALAEQLKGLDDRIAEMEERAADFIINYGEEDFRSQMLLMFIDVAIEMKEAVKIFDSVNMATQFIYECTGFIDDSLQFNLEMQDRSLTSKYGVWQRLRIRIKNYKTVRNNTNRMRVMMEQMGSQLEMARTMVDSMQYACTKMRESMARTSKKRAEKEAKRARKGEVKTVLSNRSVAAERVAAIVAQKRAATGASEGAPGAKGNASGAVGANEDYTNIDDVT